MEAGFNKVETYTLMLLPGSEMYRQEQREKYGFVTKFRAIPKCFGYFDFLGEDICTGEVEEVVCGNNTLSFLDYVWCRELAFLVELFHNDGLFDLPIRLLKSLGIKVFDCIGCIRRGGVPHEVEALVADFRQETIGELWGREDILGEIFVR